MWLWGCSGEISINISSLWAKGKEQGEVNCGFSFIFSCNPPVKAFSCLVPPSPASSAQSWPGSQAFRLKVNPVPEFLCFHLADGRLWYMLACVVTRTGSHIMTSLKNILKSHVFLCALCVCIWIHTYIHMSWCTCGDQRQPVGVLSMYHVGPGDWI